MNVLEMNKSDEVWKERKGHRVLEQLLNSFLAGSANILHS